MALAIASYLNHLANLASQLGRAFEVTADGGDHIQDRREHFEHSDGMLQNTHCRKRTCFTRLTAIEYHFSCRRRSERTKTERRAAELPRAGNALAPRQKCSRHKHAIFSSPLLALDGNLCPLCLIMWGKQFILNCITITAHGAHLATRTRFKVLSIAELLEDWHLFCVYAHLHRASLFITICLL
jgi:hypothetical protein